jgi:cytochrome c-type biogenesis protein
MIMRIDEIENPQTQANLKSRLVIFLHAVAFVIGFTIIFVIGWGGAATLLGGLFREYKDWIARIGGLVLIFFGLATMDVIRVPWFYMDTRPEFKGRTGTFVGSLAMGLFFAAGWSPCIGATLGAILTLGYSQDTIWQSMILSSGYSLGMGIPFLLLAIGLEGAMPLVRRMRKYLRTFQIISGLLIIAIGIMLISAQMTVLANWAMKTGLYLDLPSQASGAPGYLTAVAAGVLSFLSPCVLPLVPAYLGYLSGHAITAVKQADTPTNFMSTYDDDEQDDLEGVND